MKQTNIKIDSDKHSKDRLGTSLGDLLRFRDFTIKSKLTIGFSLLLLMMIVVSVAVYVTVSSMLESASRVNHTFAVINQGEHIQRLLVDIETDMRGFMVTGETGFIQDFSKSKLKLQQALDIAVSLNKNDIAQVTRIERVREMSTDWLSRYVEENIALRHKVKAGQASMEDVAKLMQTGVGSQYMQTMRTYLHDFNRTEERLMSQRASNAKDLANLAIFLTLGGTIFAILIGIIVATGISRNVVGSVRKLVDGAEIIGQGDEQFKISTGSRDEFGYLARAFNEMLDKLRFAQEETKNTSQQLQAVLDNVVDGIITIDARGIVQSLNPSAESIFGYSSHEVIGNNVKMLMPEYYATEHDGYLHRYLETGEAHIIGIGREVEGKRKNGTTFPMDLAVSQMEINGKVMFSGIVRDITERKRIEIMKNEFISTVSHELRTPLTSIRGALGLISGGAVGGMPDQAQEMLKIASNNTERLLLLINDILDIQKIESGRMAFHFQSLDIKPFLQQVVTDSQAYANQFDVKLVLRDIPDKMRVFADKDRLMQVMNNLVSNAAKFSRRGENVEISVAKHAGNIRVSVTDHGPGIPADFQPKLFEKFTQSDTSDTRKKGGTGLGLSIAKLIMEKHGGRIGFFTKERFGSTFYFELPELLTGLTKGDLPIALENEHFPCVLIVEDDEDVAALLQRMLSEAGINSDIAYSAAEARQLLDQNSDRYKAMTLDIILPDEDGISFLTTLRQEADTRDLPIVIVSVKADEARRELNGGAVGVVDWLNKPIDVARLKHVIRQATGAKQTPKILHVEDEEDVHRIVSELLKNECELVWAATLEASRDELMKNDFDLVLLDIGMPDGSGLELLDMIELRVHPPRVVIFSAQEVDKDISSKVNAVLIKSHTSNEMLLDTITGAIREVE